MKVGAETRKKIVQLVNQAIEVYSAHIDVAYTRADGPLKISLNATIKPTNQGNAVSVAIGFVSDQVKDAFSDTVDEDQMGLFQSGDVE